MTVRPIDYGSAEYAQACELRRRFLREPIGLELTDADTADDASQHHFGLFDERGGLIGGLIGKPDPDRSGAVRIRQVVIHEARRGHGGGRKLMLDAETQLAAAGYTRCVLYARPEAASFYERCGYSATGETKELIGFTHQEMVKALATGETSASE